MPEQSPKDYLRAELAALRAIRNPAPWIRAKLETVACALRYVERLESDNAALRRRERPIHEKLRQFFGLPPSAPPHEWARVLGELRDAAQAAWPDVREPDETPATASKPAAL